MDHQRIEKQVLLRVSRERVWRAVSDAAQFGSWFGAAFDGAFAPGARLHARIVPTALDAEIARLQQPHAGVTFEFLVERVEPMRYLSFRWHPLAVEPGVDYSGEPTTLVAFELQEIAGDTLLRISESGFEQLTPARRTQAFAAHDSGWAQQARLIEKFLASHPEGGVKA